MITTKPCGGRGVFFCLFGLGLVCFVVVFFFDGVFLCFVLFWGVVVFVVV